MESFASYSGKGITGLANLGNTCFINATLQCFSHSYKFNNFLKDKKYEQFLNKKPESLILVEWDKLRDMMWSENCIISPGGFLNSVQRVAKLKNKHIFTGFAQNDLPEFIKHDTHFHETLVQAGGNAALVTAFEAIWEYHQYSQIFSSSSDACEETAQTYHKKIVQALEKKNKARAIKSLKDHFDHML